MNNIIFLSQGQGENVVNEEINFEVTINKDGLPIIKTNKFFLQSPYQPLKEAKRIVEDNYQVNSLHIIIGLGLGYVACELASKLQTNDFLIVYEPQKAIFDAALKDGNIDYLLNHERVKIIVGNNLNQLERTISPLILGKYSGRTQIIETPNYGKIYQGLITKIYQLVKEFTKLTMVNINTSRFFSKPWQENLLYNFRYSWKATPLIRFYNKFAAPIIIAASGPSLNKQIDLLKSIQNRAFIICAGSTINPLLNAGIKPHLVVSIDGSEANFKHFEGIDYGGPLVYSLRVHKDIPRNHKGPKIIFNNEEKQITEWVNHGYGEELGFVTGGGSVANFCLDIALKITSGPICFVGQDLAYTNNKSHAEGNKYLKDINIPENLENTHYLFCEGYYGDKVITDYSFFSMRKSFEMRIAMQREKGDNREIINSTEGGANIEGTKKLAFSEFIQSYCDEKYIGELDIITTLDTVNKSKEDQILESLESELDKVVKVNRLCKKALDTLGYISKENIHVDGKKLRKLEKIDLELNDLLVNNILYYFVLPTIYEIQFTYGEKMDETELEKTQRVLKKSEILYKAILEAANYTEDLLTTVLSS